MGKRSSNGVASHASEGGRARAAKMTAAERRKSATTAALVRWGKTPPLKATHLGNLGIGEAEIECAVLENGRRVISQRGILRALRRDPTGFYRARKEQEQDGEVTPIFLAPARLKPFISDELRSLLNERIIYDHGKGGVLAHGVDATVLPKICEVWLKARDAGVLMSTQKATAEAADLLMRGLAHVGIIALVDRATGYQDYSARDTLAEILRKFIAKELRPWVRTFEPDFYKEMFRLRSWQYQPLSMARPGVAAYLTNDVVYKRLAPGVLAELKRTAKEHQEKNQLRTKPRLFRALTDDIGHPKLKEHLAVVTALMQVSATWDGFIAMLDRVRPRFGDNLLLPFPEPKLLSDGTHHDEENTVEDEGHDHAAE